MTDSLSIRHAQGLPAVLPDGQQLEVINQVFDHCARQVTFDRNQLQQLERYLAFTGGDWARVEVVGWLDSLEGLTLEAKATYANQIKGAYKKVMRRHEFKPLLTAAFGGPDYRADAQDYRELVTDLLGEVNIRVIKAQDRDTRKHLWLTLEEGEALINAPFLADLQPIIQARDSLMIYIGLHFGLRAAEIADLRRDDILQQGFNETPALWVNDGKGSKSRSIPMSHERFADLRQRVLTYLELAQPPKDSPLFWSVTRHEKLRQPLNEKSFGLHILPRYPIKRNGIYYKVDPHDLRRTFAQRWKDDGMDDNYISLNMGHTDTKITRGYFKPDSEGRIVK